MTCLTSCLNDLSLGGLFPCGLLVGTLGVSAEVLREVVQMYNLLESPGSTPNRSRRHDHRSTGTGSPTALRIG
jgi:hypothetical protein